MLPQTLNFTAKITFALTRNLTFLQKFKKVSLVTKILLKHFSHWRTFFHGLLTGKGFLVRPATLALFPYAKK